MSYLLIVSYRAAHDDGPFVGELEVSENGVPAVFVCEDLHDVLHSARNHRVTRGTHHGPVGDHLSFVIIDKWERV